MFIYIHVYIFIVYFINSVVSLIYQKVVFFTIHVVINMLKDLSFLNLIHAYFTRCILVLIYQHTCTYSRYRPYFMLYFLFYTE